MRIIAPDHAGVRSAKWITKIEVRETPSDAPVQVGDYKLFPPSVEKDTADWSQGLTINAMPVTSAICIPEAGERISGGNVVIEGYAVAYGRTVARVDVSTDGGLTWNQATLRTEPEARAAWTLWSIHADLSPGTCELVVRAIDSSGQGQPKDIADIWNFAGYLATAWHRVQIEVEA